MWRERPRGPIVLGALIAFGLPPPSSAFQSTPPAIRYYSSNSTVAESHNISENANASVHVATVAQHSHKKPLTESDVIRKALTAAGNEFARQEIATAAKKNEAEDKEEEAQRAKVHQQAHAEQLEAQKAIQKVLKEQQRKNLKKGVKVDSQSTSTPLSAWERKVKSIEVEEKDKEKELSVQTKLVKEKMVDAQQASKVVEEMKEKTGKLHQEAEISAKIAKEKQDAAEKAAAQEATAEKKLESLSEEEKVTQKFLAQTRKEEAALQAKLKSLKEEQVASKKQDAADRKRKAEAMKKKAHEEAEAAQRDLEAAKREELAAEEKEKEEVKVKAPSSPTQEKAAEKPADSHQVAGKLNAATTTAVPPTDPPKRETQVADDNHQNQTVEDHQNQTAAAQVVKDPDVDRAEQVKRLLAENARLQQQKQDLETQLDEKKAAERKAAAKTNTTKKESKTKAFLLLEENEKLREVTASLKRQLMSSLKA